MRFSFSRDDSAPLRATRKFVRRGDDGLERGPGGRPVRGGEHRLAGNDPEDEERRRRDCEQARGRREGMKDEPPAEGDPLFPPGPRFVPSGFFQGEFGDRRQEGGAVAGQPGLEGGREPRVFAAGFATADVAPGPPRQHFPPVLGPRDRSAGEMAQHGRSPFLHPAVGPPAAAGLAAAIAPAGAAPVLFIRFVRARWRSRLTATRLLPTARAISATSMSSP